MQQVPASLAVTSGQTSCGRPLQLAHATQQIHPCNLHKPPCKTATCSSSYLSLYMRNLCGVDSKCALYWLACMQCAPRTA
jgi:hypothetical protein